MNTRRHFIKGAAGLVAGSLLARQIGAQTIASLASLEGKWFDISLAQWSLNKAFKAGTKDKMRFAQIAKNEFGVRAIEYVNQFYMEGFSQPVTNELLSVSNGEGVRNVLFMIDREGNLGDPDEAKRAQAIDNHIKWIDAAKQLGCHSIRVNARSEGSFDEQMKLAADGLGRLTKIGEKYGISVIVENHGGLSSNGAWLAGVMRLVDNPSCGTLPDFGNFFISFQPREMYDRYLGTKQLMPFAKGVSAKAYDFDENGDESRIDYKRILDVVKNAGYRGYVGIEYEGRNLGEEEGVIKTRDLLIKLGGRL